MNFPTINIKILCILVAVEAYKRIILIKDKTFLEWAENFISGKDRSVRGAISTSDLLQLLIDRAYYRLNNIDNMDMPIKKKKTEKEFLALTAMHLTYFKDFIISISHAKIKIQVKHKVSKKIKIRKDTNLFPIRLIPEKTRLKKIFTLALKKY